MGSGLSLAAPGLLHDAIEVRDELRVLSRAVDLDRASDFATAFGSNHFHFGNSCRGIELPRLEDSVARTLHLQLRAGALPAGVGGPR